jgi:DedD protein
MGLFSSSKKNKQDKLAQNFGQDDGHFSRAEDEAIGEKARAKRASNAGGAAGRARKDAPDPVLPEKKRARRRLVGAIALAVAAIIGIPMLLDSEPKPLNGDIAIEIPSKERAAALPAPAAPAPAAPVDAADTLDKREEIVTSAAPAPAPAPARTEASRKASKYDTELRDEPIPPLVLAEKPAPKPEKKAEPKPEPKVAKVDKPVEKTVKVEKPKPVKKEEKADAHPLADKRGDDTSRALAILEDKDDRADKPARVERAPDVSSQRFVLQVAALASQEKVTELQAKLAGAGLRSYTQKSETATGAHVIRVRVGPFSKEEAEKNRGKLSAMGLSGSMVPVQ